VDGAERREEGKTHGRRATRAVCDFELPSKEEEEPDRLRGDVGESAAFRPAQIQSKNRLAQVRSGQLSAGNELVEALIRLAEVLEESGHSNRLVD